MYSEAMASNLNKIFIVSIVAIAALLQRSKAQTTHIVGDALGWLVPPSTDTYTTWAANQTFRVGDVLVFNFAAGRHDVAQVTEAAFNACNSSNPILRETNSPVNVTLSSSGEFYYICTFSGHCSGGQKLRVNVSAAAASPAPQPVISPSPIIPPTPTPVTVPTPTPTPSPTRNPVTYVVGDQIGWTIPANTSVGYQNWASGKTFMVGDILVFNYAMNAHDVAEVTKQAYASCDSNSTISLNSSPPTRITLTTPGEHFFICTFPNHCSAGQQLAINVTGTATAPSPSPSIATSPTPTPSVATPPPTSTNTPSPPPPTGQTGNSAKSLNAAGVSFTFLAIIFVGLLY
ncbi:blue copper protein-like [Mangifera indica]|uniref:blue copper protein-like n=1 Tax=Mangifera indica TaxID=29780 RepID=UPI001CFB1DF5|nr:blue copper protein-like [Mangifera indica]